MLQTNKHNWIKSLTAVALLFMGSAMTAQTTLKSWTPIFEKDIKAIGERVIVPKKYKTFRVADDFKNVKLLSHR